MKDSEIYLQAAKRLQVLCLSGDAMSPYCCDELKEFERQRDEFIWWFQPSEEEASPNVVGWWGDPPMRWEGVTPEAEEMHLQRTLALCFMAAIAKSEGR